jgi:hypothetical protein
MPQQNIEENYYHTHTRARITRWCVCVWGGAVICIYIYIYIYTVFTGVICALFSSLAAEKSGCVKYVDFFCEGLGLGFILV